MAEPGGPKSENEVGAAFIRLEVVGAPETKATLEDAAKKAKEVEKASDKQATVSVDGQKKVTAATKETVASFADLKSKLQAAAPESAAFVAGFGALGVAVKLFAELEQHLEGIINKYSGFDAKNQRSAEAAEGIGNFDAAIESGTIGYSKEAMQAAGVEPAGFKTILDRVKASRRRLHGDPKSTDPATRDGLLAQYQAGEGKNGGGITDPSQGSFIGQMYKQWEIEQEYASLKPLEKQLGDMLMRNTSAGRKLREVRSNIPFQEAAQGAMNNSVYGGGGDLQAAFEKLSNSIDSLDRSVRASNINK